ncbi:cuticle protein 19-like [Penaeus monodon]|uniref:cuticle protein 19-like n=1 Tax=Penaeus monodon TaxID=6687 RepID=UPI0018A72A63|nr:cuticle protein 19-like [Penaeus monodon]
MASLKLALAVALAVVAVVASLPSDGYGKEPGMPYDFAYAVKDDYSGNDFGHNENSDGNVVTGEYYVLLPDGRRQIVTYTADHNTGYVADVRYEGEATYPAPAPQGYGQ